MEQIIGEYVADINSDPTNALGNIVTNYGGQTFNGITVTTQYITFDDISGDEQTGGSDYLKVVLQASGLGPPAITGRYPLITVFARTRDTNDDHFVLY
jgi:hypothetical protein